MKRILWAYMLCACPIITLPSNSLAVELVYIAAGQEVLTYDLDGNLMSSISVPSPIINLAVDHQGNVFTQTLSMSTLKYNPAGDLLPFGLQSGGVPLGLVWGIEVGPDDLLYVGVNSDSRTLQRYGLDGTYVDTLPSTTSKRGLAHEIAFDSLGRPYRTHNHQLIRYEDPTSSPDVFATTNIRFQKPWHLAIDSQDYVYALNLGGNGEEELVEVFNTQGESIGLFSPDALPDQAAVSIALDSSDRLFIGFTGRGAKYEVKTYLPDGAFLSTFATNLGGGVSDIVIRQVVPEPGTFGLAVILLGGRLVWRPCCSR